jgi:hypothetical protein
MRARAEQPPTNDGAPNQGLNRAPMGNMAALDLAGLSKKQRGIVGKLAPEERQGGASLLGGLDADVRGDAIKDVLHLDRTNWWMDNDEKDRRQAIRARLTGFLAEEGNSVRGAQMLKHDLLLRSSDQLTNELADRDVRQDDRYRGAFPQLTGDEIGASQLTSFDPGGHERGRTTTGWGGAVDAGRRRAAALGDVGGASKNLADMWTMNKGDAKWFVKGGSDQEVRMESATRGLAEQLGLQDHVLPVQTRTQGEGADAKNYMITPFVEGTDLKDIRKQGDPTQHPALSQENLSDDRLMQLYLMDFLTAQSDRNPGNVRVGQDGSVLAIDNESSMGATNHTNANVTKAALKAGSTIGGSGLSRTTKENAFLDLILRRKGLDPKAMAGPEVIEALADVPLPAEFLTRVADSRGDVEAMFERQGVNPRYYQEGAALLGHEGARAGGGTLGGLLRGLPQDVKVMPQMDEVSAQELAQSFV